MVWNPGFWPLILSIIPKPHLSLQRRWRSSRSAIVARTWLCRRPSFLIVHRCLSVTSHLTLLHLFFFYSLFFHAVFLLQLASFPSSFSFSFLFLFHLLLSFSLLVLFSYHCFLLHKWKRVNALLRVLYFILFSFSNIALWYLGSTMCPTNWESKLLSKCPLHLWALASFHSNKRW